MVEVQNHGFYFENWVKDTFFDKYRGSYGDKWDIPAEFNRNHGNISVSIKTAKYGSTINLGDAPRQYNINEDFLMIVGFWKQIGNLKSIVNVSAVVVKKDVWRKLWQPLSISDINKLDSLIKNLKEHYSKVRVRAQKLKTEEPFSLCKITLNPKIDSKTQRRLQCGIRFNLYFNELAKGVSSDFTNQPLLFRQEAPKPWDSSSRIFNHKTKR